MVTFVTLFVTAVLRRLWIGGRHGRAEPSLSAKGAA
jgi:hypothetical protein